MGSDWYDDLTFVIYDEGGLVVNTAGDLFEYKYGHTYLEIREVNGAGLRMDIVDKMFDLNDIGFVMQLDINSTPIEAIGFRLFTDDEEPPDPPTQYNDINPN